MMVFRGQWLPMDLACFITFVSTIRLLMFNSMSGVDLLVLFLGFVIKCLC